MTFIHLMIMQQGNSGAWFRFYNTSRPGLIEYFKHDERFKTKDRCTRKEIRKSLIKRCCGEKAKVERSISTEAEFSDGPTTKREERDAVR